MMNIYEVTRFKDRHGKLWTITGYDVYVGTSHVFNIVDANGNERQVFEGFIESGSDHE